MGDIPDTTRFDMLVTGVNDHAQTGQADSAFAWSNRAYALSKQLSDTLRSIQGTLSLSWTLRDRGDIEQVLEKALEAEQLCEATGNVRMQIYAVNTIASVYYDLGNDSLQQARLEQAYALGTSNNMLMEVTPAMTNLAMIYYEGGRQDEALELLSQVLDLERQLPVPDYNSMELVFGHIVAIYDRREDYALCAQYTDSLLKCAHAVEWHERIVLCRAKRLMYQELAGETVAASSTVDSLNAIDESAFQLDTRKQFLQTKVQVNKHFGRFEEALAFREALSLFEDSLNSADLRQQIAHYQEAFNTEQNEREIAELENAQTIAALEADQQQQRIGLLLLALLLLGGLLGVAIWLNRRLTKTKAELESLNAVKDRFFAIISHDLRNSVTAFEGIGAVIDAHIKRERWERLTTLGRQLDSEAEKLNRFLNSLLEWALIQLKRMPVNPENIALEPAIQEQVALYATQLEHKQVAIDVQVNSAHTAYTDTNALAMAVRNVLGNAIKFSQVGGRILVASEMQQSKVTIRIADEGVGMAPATLQKLFSVAQRTTHKGTMNETGTGLGLVLVREVLELNGGCLHVESTEGKGTTVTFELPTAQS